MYMLTYQTDKAWQVNRSFKTGFLHTKKV